MNVTSINVTKKTTHTHIPISEMEICKQENILGSAPGNNSVRMRREPDGTRREHEL